MNPLTWLKSIPALIMAGLAIVALFFRGQAANAKKDLAERNLKASQAQTDQIARANRAAEKGAQEALQKEAEDVKKSKSGNSFNDW